MEKEALMVRIFWPILTIVAFAIDWLFGLAVALVGWYLYWYLSSTF